jgi:hypothetical protein
MLDRLEYFVPCDEGFQVRFQHLSDFPYFSLSNSLDSNIHAADAKRVARRGRCLPRCGLVGYRISDRCTLAGLHHPAYSRGFRKTAEHLPKPISTLVLNVWNQHGLGSVIAVVWILRHAYQTTIKVPFTKRRSLRVIKRIRKWNNYGYSVK